MRLERNTERDDPQTLEITLIDRFKMRLKSLRSEVKEEDDDNDSNKPILTVQSDGNGAHYSERKSPTDRSEEFFIAETSETGEVIVCEFIELDDDGKTTDIMSVTRGQIRTSEGFLIQSTNPQVIQSALNRLSQIQQKVCADPAIPLGQELPSTNLAALH